MKFVKVKDEERPGDVAINLDLVREAHFGGGLLRLYFERGASQDDMTFTGENAKTIWAAMGSCRRRKKASGGHRLSATVRGISR